MDPDLHAARCAVIGRGRLGPALAAALREAGLTVAGPLGRGADAAGCDLVLLAVPDGEIAAAAGALRPAPGALVGHLSGATPIAGVAFGLHPLMTVVDARARFAGATAAVAGRDARALAVATALARRLGMEPVALDDADRAAYHAAASIAANFLVTVEGVAERLAATAGVPRSALAPLVRAAVEGWAAHGARRALTGPIARGDEATVVRQRAAVADRAPDALGLFDALAAATRDLAAAPAR